MGSARAVVQGLPALNSAFSLGVRLWIAHGNLGTSSWLRRYMLQMGLERDRITVWNWELPFAWLRALAVYNSFIEMDTFDQRGHRKGVKTL